MKKTDISISPTNSSKVKYLEKYFIVPNFEDGQVIFEVVDDLTNKVFIRNYVVKDAPVSVFFRPKGCATPIAYYTILNLNSLNTFDELMKKVNKVAGDKNSKDMVILGIEEIWVPNIEVKNNIKLG